MKSYGITDSEAMTGDPDLALALEELDRNGFTVLTGVLEKPLIAALRDALDRVLALQMDRFGGATEILSIGDANQARALLNDDDLFLSLLQIERVDALVEALLGPAAIVLQQNGIVMPPAASEHQQQSWHRDLPYQSWIASKPLALGALAVLDDFTPQSGSTLFLPGSHRHAKFPSKLYTDQWAYAAHAPAGTVIVFDAMCYHRGGVNFGHVPRRAVNTLFGVPLLSQQILFRDRSFQDEKLRRRLGIDYRAAADVDAYRTKRAERLSNKL